MAKIGRTAYGQVLADFYHLIREAIAELGGREVGTQGDSVFIAFDSASKALAGAAVAQRALTRHAWPADTALRVRMGIHTGEATLADGDYLGLSVHRAARICSAAHGGQVLVSQTARDLGEDDLPAELMLRDLGERRLRDLHRPERLFQLEIEGLRADFPPARGAADPATAPALVRYTLLGPVAALTGEGPVDLGGPRQRGVLVVLLPEAGALVPASRIIDAIWGDEPPASAANLVQRSVSRLRKALGRDAIETRGGGYLARVEPDALDMHVFERLARSGSGALDNGRFGEAASTLREALGLWRGPALADLVDEPFLDGEAARLEEMRVLAQERALEAELGCGRHADVLAEAQALVDAHPFREQPRALVMRTLYATGRQADALEAYRRTRAAFVGELGIEPGPGLQELERAILRQDASLAAEAPTAPADTSPALRTASESCSWRPSAAADPTPLMPLAEALAREPQREIVLAETVPDARDLGPVSRRLHDTREILAQRGVEARAAAFTSVTPGADLARLATEQDVDLLLSEAPAQLLEDGRLITLLEQAPCDVGVLVGSGYKSRAGRRSLHRSGA